MVTTRKDLQNLAEDMISCAVHKLSPEKAWLNAGESSAPYPHKTAWIEGFLRPLFGLVPLSAGDTTGRSAHLWEVYRTGIIHGTDPASAEYWGGLEEHDQKIVEMTTLGLALAMVPEHVWEPLTKQQKENLAAWLGQINDVGLATNNWLFFHVVVNMGLKKVGAPYRQDIMEQALNNIEKSNLADGWYSEGPSLQRDYYIPFAMHFYGLIYSVLMGEEDPERAAKYRERAAAFAQDFVYWFAKEGDALPFGRSLTYRFAMCAFWSGLAYAGVEALPWGVIKGIILRNIRWWLKQPVFDQDGLLTIGYRYPNLKMAEFYNAPGSPAWAMKAFLILALPENHPFWTAEEEELPALKPVSVQKHPFMLFMRNEDGSHIQALTSGQYARFEPTFMAAKYEKFAYSNVFGFSVPGGEYGLAQGAFDSMLALCEENDNHYRVRHSCEYVKIDETSVYSIWKPWHDVTIQTWLIPCGPWHVRVHRIESARNLESGEGAYAVNCDFYEGEPENYEILEETGMARAAFPWAATGIVDLKGDRNGVVVAAHPNTNVLYSRTRIPTLTGKIPAGVTWLSCAVLGVKTPAEAEDAWKIQPEYRREQDSFRVTYRGTCRKYGQHASDL